jgi:hypothetical protein
MTDYEQFMMYCQTGCHPDLVIPGKRLKMKSNQLEGKLLCVTCGKGTIGEDFALDMIDERTRQCKDCYKKALRLWSKEKPVDKHLMLTMTAGEVLAYKASKRYTHK